MQLATFDDGQGARIGIVEGDTIADIAALGAGTPRDMLGLIRRVVEVGSGGSAYLAELARTAPKLQRAAVNLLAPIPRPHRNIFCIGKNYREHAEEFHRSGFDASAGANAVPDDPIVFSKPPSTVIGPGAPIPAFLDPTHSVDYENELAVIIGKGGRGITPADAMSHVFGYTIVNDVTSRTLQQRHKQWLLGKGIDGFCPMGPIIVTADEIHDVGAIHLVTRVNGEVRQDAYVRDLIFDIPTLIARISALITLEPGDIIATGTPVGVGIGFSPPRFLKTGDIVSLSITPIGELSNTVS